MPAYREITEEVKCAGVRIFAIPLIEHQSSRAQVHAVLNELLADEHYSLSYTAGLGLIALSAHGPVGIDVARIDQSYPLVEVCQNFFSPVECAELMGLPDGERPFAFFRAWTCKEAFIKAIGKGFTFPIEGCEVAIPPQLPAKIVKIEGSREKAAAWNLCSFSPASNVVAAICY